MDGFVGQAPAHWYAMATKARWNKRYGKSNTVDYGTINPDKIDNWIQCLRLDWNSTIMGITVVIERLGCIPEMYGNTPEIRWCYTYFRRYVVFLTCIGILQR